MKSANKNNQVFDGLKKEIEAMEMPLFLAFKALRILFDKGERNKKVS